MARLYLSPRLQRQIGKVITPRPQRRWRVSREGGDTLRGKVVHKVGEGSKSFDLCLKFNEETATEAAMYKASNKLFTGTALLCG